MTRVSLEVLGTFLTSVWLRVYHGLPHPTTQHHVYQFATATANLRLVRTSHPVSAPVSAGAPALRHVPPGARGRIHPWISGWQEALALLHSLRSIQADVSRRRDVAVVSVADRYPPQ